MLFHRRVKTNPLKTSLAWATGCLALTAVAVMVLLILQWKENSYLRAENRRMMLDVQAARDSAQRLEQDQTALRGQLAAASTESQTLKRQLQDAEVAASKPAPTAPPVNPAPRAQQIKVFVGRDFAGYAWMLPGTTTRDAAAGITATEPVILMDASARRVFTVYQTNWVEREVMAYNTVNYNYDPYPYGWNYWVQPTWGHWQTNQLPDSSRPPADNKPRPPLRPPTTPPGASPWTPVTFDNNQRGAPSTGSPRPPVTPAVGAPTLNLTRPQPITVYPRPTVAPRAGWTVPENVGKQPFAVPQAP